MELIDSIEDGDIQKNHGKILDRLGVFLYHAWYEIRRPTQMHKTPEMKDRDVKPFRIGNERVIALTSAEYENRPDYWQTKAEEQANAIKRDVVIITEDRTRFRAWPRD